MSEDSPDWRTYTARDGWIITERLDAPPRLGGWNRLRASGLAGVPFTPYTPEQPDPRIVVVPSQMCPRCGVRPLLPVVRDLTGGTCGECAGWNRAEWELSKPAPESSA